MFKKEFGCDFTMYDLHDDPGHGLLIVDKVGRTIGGATVRWQEYSNAPASWELSWVWIVPVARRQGLLKAVWQMTRARYDGIRPAPPFSRPAALFFVKRQDVSKSIRKYAQSQLDGDNFTQRRP
jgi:hypothetical protein